MPHAGKALIDPYLVFERAKLGSGMRVGDLGCGRTGHFVFPAAKVVGDAGIVYAVDIVKDILESIKSRVRSEGYDNVQTAWGNLEKIGGTPIPAGTLDVCFMVNVMFMIKDRVTALKEAARLIKQDGQIIVVDWEKNLAALGPTSEQMITAGKLLELAGQTGLRVVEKFMAGEYHFAVILKKI